MVQYRRNHAPGGTFFFTVTLHDRRSDVLVRHIDLLRAAFNAEKARRPFRIDAMVVLPEHLHAIWTLPADDTSYSARWRAIKTSFVMALTREGFPLVRNPRGAPNMWQARFWEHTIRDEDDLNNHINYIHYNPVKHGYVTRPADWPHSTIHRFIEADVLPATWGENDDAGRELDGAGERS